MSGSIEKKLVGIAGACVWVAGWLGAVIELVSEGVTWLRTARWPNWSPASLLSDHGVTGPYTSWAGSQKVIDLVLSCPLSLALLICGVGGGMWLLHESSKMP